MIASGEPAPLFDLAATRDGRVALAALKGRPVILYFYPQADTPGCTIESKRFRDLYPKLKAKGVEVLGISTDDLPDQSHFSEKCSLPFPLLADPTKETTKAYGVLGLTGRARRVSFFIDPTGRVDEVVDASRPDPHLERAAARFL